MEYLNRELEQVNKLIAINKGNLERLNGTPEGFLRIAKKRASYQYYFKGENEEKERYLKVAEQNIAKNVAQLDYERKACKFLKSRQRSLLSALKYMEETSIDEVYEKMGDGRRQIVTPLVPAREEFVKKWYIEHPGNMNTYPLITGYETDRGEQVRSKSEKIIADMLNKYGIPYSYEPELRLGRKGAIFPDFLALNVRKRRTLVWEHMGLIDKEDYAVRNFNKLAYYEEAGYVVGHELIITMEADNMPLNIRMVEKKIKEFLL